jgi:hypothetical protein
VRQIVSTPENPDIVDSIDGALRDYELASPDAMRWSPDPEKVMVEEDYLEHDHGDYLDRHDIGIIRPLLPQLRITRGGDRLVDLLGPELADYARPGDLIAALTRDSFRGFRAEPPSPYSSGQIGNFAGIPVISSPVVEPGMMIVVARGHRMMVSFELLDDYSRALTETIRRISRIFDSSAAALIRAFDRRLRACRLGPPHRRTPAAERTISRARRAGSRRTKRLSRRS